MALLPPADRENRLMQTEEVVEDEYNALVGLINKKFQSCKDSRNDDENRWLQAYHNYRGRYYKDVHFTQHEKSRVFVKVTKTKVLAAYGQIIDVLFGMGKFPLTIQETEVPEGIAKYAHMNPLKEQVGDENMQPTPSVEGNLEYIPGQPMSPTSNLGFPGDGKPLAKGATFDSLNESFLGGLEPELEKAELSEGPGHLPEFPQIKPAQIAARRLEKLIHDQLSESNGNVTLRNAIFESCLLGTGIIKGPFTYNKTLHKYTGTGNGNARDYTPDFVKVPKVEFVSIWDFYPDPNARNMDECEFIIQRHRVNRHQFLDLINRPYFSKEKIE